MNNQTTIRDLAGSVRGKGRSIMETAVYALCSLSAIAVDLAVCRATDARSVAGFDPAAQPVPVVSHAVKQCRETKS